MEHPHTEQQPPDLEGFRERSLNHGVNPFMYWTLRALFVPFFLIYLRMQRIGREHLPRRGAADPGLQPPQLPRPLRDRHARAAARLLHGQARAVREALAGLGANALGAFPVDRGAGDEDAMDTARAILARGDCVVVFPEGTRMRSGGLGEPRRGVGRLALETRRAGVPRSPSSAPTRCAAAGAYARARSACGSVRRCSSRASKQSSPALRRCGHRARVGLREPPVGVARRRARCGRARAGRAPTRAAPAPQARPSTAVHPEGDPGARGGSRA